MVDSYGTSGENATIAEKHMSTGPRNAENIKEIQKVAILERVKGAIQAIVDPRRHAIFEE